MKNKITIMILIFYSTFTFGQNSYGIEQFKNDTFDFFKQPSKWDNNDLLKIGLVGASTFLLIQADQSIRNEVMKDRSYFNSFPIEFGRRYGELYSPVILSGLFGLNGLINDDIKSKKLVLKFYKQLFMLE